MVSPCESEFINWIIGAISTPHILESPKAIMKRQSFKWGVAIMIFCNCDLNILTFEFLKLIMS